MTGKSDLIKKVAKEQGMEVVEVSLSDTIEVDEFHFHEVTDRAYLAGQMLDSMFEGHPVIQQSQEFKELVTIAQDAMADLYQLAGNRRFE
jgi:hypothetical protein